MFKESRSHDHMEAKSDAETQLRSRKLPLTRKIYAFYRAPIVKFWSNTVGRLQSRAQARARGRGQPGAVHVYQRRAPGNRLWLLAAGGARAEVDGKKHCGAVTFTSMSGISSHELLPPCSCSAAPGGFSESSLTPLCAGTALFFKSDKAASS